MPSEDQLKAQMQAAIAKKKSEKKEEKEAKKPEPEKTNAAAKGDDKPAKKIMTAHPAIYQPMGRRAENVKPKKDDGPRVDSSEAELSRSFFGRSIRVAIHNKRVYFAIPDVLNTSSDFDRIDEYDTDEFDTKDDKSPIKHIRFPSPNGGHDILDAAQADDIIKIIKELEFNFPEPIEKWLGETTESLMILI